MSIGSTNHSQRLTRKISRHKLSLSAVAVVVAITSCLQWSNSVTRLLHAGDGWTAAPGNTQKSAVKSTTIASGDRTIKQTSSWMLEWKAASEGVQHTVLSKEAKPALIQTENKVAKPAEIWDLSEHAEAGWTKVIPAGPATVNPASESASVAKASESQLWTLDSTVKVAAQKPETRRDTTAEATTASEPQDQSVNFAPKTIPATSPQLSLMTLSNPDQLTSKREATMAMFDVSPPKVLAKDNVLPQRGASNKPAPEQHLSTTATAAEPVMMQLQASSQRKPQVTVQAPQTPHRSDDTAATSREAAESSNSRKSSQSERLVASNNASDTSDQETEFRIDLTSTIPSQRPTWRAAAASETLLAEATESAPATPTPVPSQDVAPLPVENRSATNVVENQELVGIDPHYDHSSLMHCPPEVGYPCSRVACGVHCNGACRHRELKWNDSWMIPWEVFAQGEYVGPSRLPHVPEYRLRVDDQIEFVYRLTGEKTAQPYRINTGDTLLIQSLTSENLNREVLVQPDGTISVTHLGQVLAAGRSIDELREDLEQRYREQVRNPEITVTPIKLNTVLEELRATVDSRFGNGGQSRIAKVTPEGTVQLPAIGSVPAHGLTLAELGAEIEYRYEGIVDGLEVTPILAQRAPRFLYVLGEVRSPGRYTLEGPTTLMQAVSLAGGWNVGANLKQVVVFRRDENWQLMATKVNICRPLYGKDPCPEGELWLRDSDIVVIPKHPILVADEFIELVFTRGIYAVIPFSTNLSYFRDLSGVGGIVAVP